MKGKDKGNSLAWKQYGIQSSRLEETLRHTQALNIILLFVTVELLRKIAVYTTANIRPCYNLVVHSISGLCFFYQGAPDPTFTYMFAALQDVVIRTRIDFSKSIVPRGDVYV